MGNVTRMHRAPLKVVVIKPDGTFAEYNYPIRVAMLMALYPDYLVVQSSSTDPAAPGASRKIKVMDMEERLQLGQSYMMYPIPAEYKEVATTPLHQKNGHSSSRRFTLRLSLSGRRSKSKKERVKWIEKKLHETEEEGEIVSLVNSL